MLLFGPPNIAKLQAKHDVDGLIKALHYDKDVTICQDAAKALGHLRDPQAIGPLTKLLNDTKGDDQVRTAAIWALATIGTPESLEQIVNRLDDKTLTVRQAAAEALGRAAIPDHTAPLLDVFKRRDHEMYPAVLHALVAIGKQLDDTTRAEQIVEPLAQIIHEEKQPVRIAIIESLEQMGWKPDHSHLGAIYRVMKQQWDACVEIGAPAAEPLIAILYHEDKHIRQAAFNALVEIGAPAAEPLIAALRHDETEIRQATYWALAKIGPPVIEQVIAALKDEHEEVRRACAALLGQIGLPQAVVPLIGTFNDLDWGVRRDAYKSIVKIGKAALPELLKALKHPNGEIRWGAAGTLEALGWKPSQDEIGAIYWIVKGEWHKCIDIGAPAVRPLIDSLGHWDPNVCKEAVGTLVHIGEPSVLPLIATLKNEYPAVRRCAATALGLLGDERAEQPLMELLSEKDKEVSQAASEAISAIQTGEVWRGTS